MKFNLRVFFYCIIMLNITISICYRMMSNIDEANYLLLNSIILMIVLEKK